jgi:hypothetical protein
MRTTRGGTHSTASPPPKNADAGAGAGASGCSSGVLGAVKRKRVPKTLAEFTEVRDATDHRGTGVSFSVKLVSSTNSVVTTITAKKRAFITLDRCLNSYCLDAAEHQTILDGTVEEDIHIPRKILILVLVRADVLTAFQETPDAMRLSQTNVDDVEFVKTGSKIVRQSYRVEAAHNKIAKTADKTPAAEIDGSNEFCEVCNKEGNLLCCDTCSLVFHLGCLRPKLDVVPEGSWNCPYCVIDVSSGFTYASEFLCIIGMCVQGRAFGFVDLAYDSISKLRRLCHGRVNLQEVNNDPSLKGFLMRLGQVKDRVSILKTAGRYLVRKADNSNKGTFAELGRYDTYGLLNFMVRYSNSRCVDTTLWTRPSRTTMNCSLNQYQRDRRQHLHLLLRRWMNQCANQRYVPFA